MSNFIPVNKPLFEGNEKKYLIDCIESGWISSEGPYVEKFEIEFARYHNSKYAISVSSGTAAIDCAIEALGLSEGDEIIVPDFTIISCLNQIIRSKIKPILVDCNKQTFNIDVKDIEKKITNKTKAIFVVHIYGLPVEMTKVLFLAKKYKLKIIEDSAEQLGQKYRNKLCGTFGDLSIFSFYPNKHITTGEGGMILTNNKSYYEKCKSYRNICFEDKKRFVHHKLGWNYRMTNIQAAIGLAQLEQINKFIKIKREIGKKYNSLLFSLKDNFQLPLEKTQYSENIYWVYSLVSQDKKKNAYFYINSLKDSGVGARPFFYPIHKQPVFRKMGFFKGENYINSSFIYKYGFYIPSGLGITDNEIEIVYKSLKGIV